MNAWVARNLVYRPAALLRGEATFRKLRSYEQSQWWPPDRVRSRQERAVAAILRYALRHTAHYRDAARARGVDPDRADAGTLERLPLLSKTDLIEGLARLQARRLPLTTSWKTTGGSTGAAVRLRKNRGAVAAEQAASWRCYAWYGVRPGDRQARFWGVAVTRRARLRSRAIDFVLNRDRFSAFAFRREDLARYFERLARARPVWAYGYVSMLSQFAAFCLDEGLPLADLGLRAVVTTSEVLSKTDRSLIARAFGAPVFDEYGCGELGAILYECERGRLHLMAENVYAELLPDATLEEPEACRLVVTDLHNRATPLIRYDLGDRVVAAGACACGRGLPAFSRVFGRAYDFIEAPDGTRFHGEFFLYAVERARDRALPIRQVQFVQTAADRIECRLVPGHGYAPAVGEELARELTERSGGRFRFRATQVAEITRERSGKVQTVKGLPAAGRPKAVPSVGRGA